MFRIGMGEKREDYPPPPIFHPYSVIVYFCAIILCQGAGQVQITWDNPEQLEEYIGKLQGAADRLTSENRRLRKCHGIVKEKVKDCQPFHLLA